MKTLIKSYHNAFPPEFCNEIIDLGNKNREFLESRQSSKFGGDSLVYQDLSMGIEDFLPSNLFNHLKSTLENYLYSYSKEFSIIRPMVEHGFYFNDYKFQVTKPTEGFHQWHCENICIFPFNLRFAVWTLYLNDIEEGGETEFLYQSTRVKPTQGTLNIFPAYYTHTHRGNPPLKETKYILTGWIEHSQILESNMINPNINK